MDEEKREIEMLLKIINSSFGNIFVTDNHGKIIFVNDPVVKDMEISREVLLSCTIYDLVDKHMVPYTPISIKVLDDHQPIIKSVRLANGTLLTLHAQPVFDKDGELEYVVVFSQNNLIVEQFMKSLQEESQVMLATLQKVMSGANNFGPFIAESKASQDCMMYAQNVARADSTVMLYGESGVGKEVLANYIHQQSLRANNLFIPINCAAIPHELMESEFFGYEGGSFTGSNKNGKTGLVEMANNGTLFLDEIGELPLPMQTKLLRMLSSGKIRPIGSNTEKMIDVRIIAATNRNLEAMVKNKQFREDLYYRINVVPIIVPPLRKRLADIPVMAEFFLSELNKKYSLKKYLSTEAMDALAQYKWPGNVRELKNIIERLFVTIDQEIIYKEDVNSVLGNPVSVRSSDKTSFSKIDMSQYHGSTLKEATELFQREYISRVLLSCDGNVAEASKVLKMGRSSLYHKLDQLNLKATPRWKYSDSLDNQEIQ